MTRTGLTSVTFRQFTPEQILLLASSTGLDGIEWGGDVHLPPGQQKAAEALAIQTTAMGLAVLSYGSYYKLGEGMDFSAVLESAVGLHAPNIRIWAGTKSPSTASEDYRRAAARELHAVCREADRMNITVSLEYHRQTLTQTVESALSLLQEADAPNLRTYWQPNPELSHAENCRELTLLTEWLSNIHVFQWQGDGTRDPLSSGEADWADYLKIARGKATSCILEFVREDSSDQFREDAAVLKRWLSGQIEGQD